MLLKTPTQQGSTKVVFIPRNRGEVFSAQGLVCAKKTSSAAVGSARPVVDSGAAAFGRNQKSWPMLPSRLNLPWKQGFQRVEGMGQPFTICSQATAGGSMQEPSVVASDVAVVHGVDRDSGVRACIGFPERSGFESEKQADFGQMSRLLEFVSLLMGGRKEGVRTRKATKYGRNPIFSDRNGSGLSFYPERA